MIVINQEIVAELCGSNEFPFRDVFGPGAPCVEVSAIQVIETEGQTATLYRPSGEPLWFGWGELAKVGAG